MFAAVVFPLYHIYKLETRAPTTNMNQWRYQEDLLNGSLKRK